MPGFLGEINKNSVRKNFGKMIKPNLLNERIENSKYYLERRTIKKFENDKIFSESSKYIIITEGVILNSLKLIEKYQSKNLEETIINMYKENGETFFNEFRGSFSGLFYDKEKDKWILFTNHIGDKQINKNLIKHVKDRLGHDRRYGIDPTKIKEELGWEPTVMFNEGIKKTIDWYLENKNWMESVISGEYKDFYEKNYVD